MLKNIFTFILVAINFLIAAFVLFSIMNNYVITFNKYRSAVFGLVNDPVQISELRGKTFPQDLQVVNIDGILNNSMADLVAQVYNPNPKWGANFEYNFSLASGQTEDRKGFIFPGETKYLVDLAVENGETATSLNIKNIDWLRVNDFVEKTAKVIFYFSQT